MKASHHDRTPFVAEVATSLHEYNLHSRAHAIDKHTSGVNVSGNMGFVEHQFMRFVSQCRLCGLLGNEGQLLFFEI